MGDHGEQEGGRTHNAEDADELYGALSGGLRSLVHRRRNHAPHVDEDGGERDAGHDVPEHCRWGGGRV